MSRKTISTLIAALLLFSGIPKARATISIPAGLTDGEQELVLQILGFGTSYRAVNNPYPLGGYSGLEMGFSVENVLTADIGYFGLRSEVTRNMMYPRLHLGKGIFDSIDLFFSFIPYSERTGVGIYSGALRWGFFQATFVPACFSLLLSASNTNINNVFIAQTMGVDLITGVNVDPFSFYVGAGTLYGQGQFDKSITSDNSMKNQTGRSFHTMIGINFAIAELFTALQVDNYSSTTVSVKIGTRL
jgi:hypothetical protein